MTLDNWRPWRGSEGWKMTMEEMRLAEELEDWGAKDMQQPPRRVKLAPRLYDDIKVLRQLTKPKHLP